MAIVTITEGFNASYASGTNQDAVIIGALNPGRSCGVQLNITSGNGKVQTTLDPATKVLDGTATWKDWAAGSVTATTQEAFVIVPVAVRCVRASGTVAMSVSLR